MLEPLVLLMLLVLPLRLRAMAVRVCARALPAGLLPRISVARAIAITPRGGAPTLLSFGGPARGAGLRLPAGRLRRWAAAPEQRSLP